MNLLGIFSVVFLSVANALPVENAASSTDPNGRNSVLEELFLSILEELRETMKTGSDTLPVLDPFELEYLHLDLDDFGLPGSYVTINDLEASLLSTFIIEDLTVSLTNLLLQRYSIELEGYVPVLEVDTDKLDMDVTVFGVRVAGTCNAKMKIIEPRITARIDVGISLIGGVGINFRDAHVVFQIKAFEPELIGMFENDTVNYFAHEYLRLLIPEMVSFFQDDISEVIRSIIMEIGSISLSSSEFISLVDSTAQLD